MTRRRPFEVVAHRGASGSAPENTLAALARAAALGAPWAEIDVQRTSDGVLVLVHDDTWKRTAGHSGRVEATPWSVVRALDAGSWFGAAFAGERAPRLDDVLEWSRSRLRLDLEIKSPENHPGIGSQVVERIRAHGVADRVLVTSFDADLVEALAASTPDVAFGYLAAAPVERAHPAVRAQALHAEVLLRDPDSCRRLHASGCRVLAWTVDDAGTAERLEAQGVDALITNHPERFLEGGRRGATGQASG